MRTNIIDMHCDTLTLGLLKGGRNADLYHFPEGMLDGKRLAESGALAQFFAIFLIPEQFYASWYHAEPMTYEECLEGCLRVFHNTLNQHSDVLAQAWNAEDVLRNQQSGKVSAVLTMEDGLLVAGKMENLDRFYELGIRALSLTWNYANCFGYPNSAEPEKMKLGLTDFGKEAVQYMQEKGILVDVSHLSDGGFYDVAEICRKPFVATHSNCRYISPHPRNLTDDMIRILAEKGGVAGINFCPGFLNEDINDDVSRVSQMVEMAKHMRQVGGIDVVGVGTDFDGIMGNLEIAGCREMHLLMDALSLNGFTDKEIDKIMYENVLRVMKDSMK